MNKTLAANNYNSRNALFVLFGDDDDDMQTQRKEKKKSTNISDN